MTGYIRVILFGGLMSRKIDMVGQRFGRLTVIKFVGLKNKSASWLCKCDCGGEHIVSRPNLIRGITRSCGCLVKESYSKRKKRPPFKKDLTGQKFGKLTVINYCYNKKSKSFWRCLCECGNETIVNMNSLRSKTTISCGCAHKDAALRRSKKEAPFNLVFNDYKRGAEKRGFIFNINRETFELLTQQNCYYCGMPPRNKATSSNHEFVYNGIDRVDNTRGYEIDNIVSCCGQCNHAKMKYTKKDFFDMVKRIYERHNLKDIN